MQFSVQNDQYKTNFDRLNVNNITSNVISSNYFLTPHQFKSIPQNTADTTSITGLTGVSKWVGGVLAPNGKIYGIPNSSTSVLIIDPVAGTADTTSITGLTGTTNKWYGGVLASNGKIYGIPRDSTSVLIIDPVNNTADTTTISGLAGTIKWVGGVLAPNGKIYGIPRNSTSVLIIDPVTNTADTTTISGLTGTNKWVGGVLAPNGKIYGMPFNSTNVLIIDPLANPNTVNTSTITGLTGTTKWMGGVLAPNGKIYGMPYSSNSVLIIDPDSAIVNISALYGINIATASYDDGSKILTCGTSLTSGLIVGDNIIISTATNTYTGYIQSLTNTSITFIYPLGVSILAPNITKIEKTRKADITTITGLTGTWVGGVLATNGKIYGIPYDSTSVLIIDPVAGTADTTSITGLTGVSKWIGGVLAPNGKIYGIPPDSTSVLQINTGLPTLPPWMLEAYFNKF